MSYVDAHLHLADPAYAGRIEQLMDDAEKNNIDCLLSNAVDFETSVETISLSKRYYGRVLAAVGIHPWTVSKKISLELEKFQQLLTDNSRYVRAIGEVGLDGKYSQDMEKKKAQREVFEFFLTLAEQKELPVVIHSRLAVDEVLETLSSFDPAGGILHWYDGPVEKLDLIRQHGYFITVGPTIFYSCRIREIALKADVGMILSETDGPVLHHGPFEGKMTQPSFVIPVIQKIAEIRSEKLEAIRDAVSRNFDRFVVRNAGQNKR